mmetsp:Transcript_8784/g.22729  ORF Transcript_8784/g.22729 Transcript_8784/m.22729 type:complete len:265 (+) Transcript_8784:34-828(+)
MRPADRVVLVLRSLEIKCGRVVPLEGGVHAAEVVEVERGEVGVAALPAARVEHLDRLARMAARELKLRLEEESARVLRAIRERRADLALGDRARADEHVHARLEEVQKKLHLRGRDHHGRRPAGPLVGPLRRRTRALGASIRAAARRTCAALSTVCRRARRSLVGASEAVVRAFEVGKDLEPQGRVPLQQAHLQQQKAHSECEELVYRLDVEEHLLEESAAATVLLELEVEHGGVVLRQRAVYHGIAVAVRLLQPLQELQQLLG